MTGNDSFYSKIVEKKTIFMFALAGLFIAYAVIGIIMIFANDNTLGSVLKIMSPLAIVGLSIVMMIDTFRRLASDKPIVQAFGFASMILGAITVLLFTLMVWEIIPMYEQSAASSLYGYYSSTTTTIFYKLLLVLAYSTAFVFLGAFIMDIKENDKTIKFLKLSATVSLGLNCILSIVGVFTGSSQSSLTSIKLTIIQYILWIVAISLGIAAFFFSKSISWDEKKNNLTETNGGVKNQEPSPQISNPFQGIKPVEVVPTTAPTTAPVTEPSSTESSLATEPSIVSLSPSNPVTAQPAQTVPENTTINHSI